MFSASSATSCLRARRCDLLVDAIRYGDAQETKQRLFRRVDDAVELPTIERLVAERKLTSEGMDPHAITAIREEMERAQARRLPPHFIGAFLSRGVPASRRPDCRTGAWAVPPVLKHRDRLIGRGDPVLDRYARVTFDKAFIASKPQPELVTPGHPLLDDVG